MHQFKYRISYDTPGGKNATVLFSLNDISSVTIEDENVNQLSNA